MAKFSFYESSPPPVVEEEVVKVKTSASAESEEVEVEVGVFSGEEDEVTAAAETEGEALAVEESFEVVQGLESSASIVSHISGGINGTVTSSGSNIGGESNEEEEEA